MLRKKSSCRSAAASLKCQAPQTFPAKTRSTSASSRVLSGVVPISPAAWTMPANGGSSACTVANRRATSCASATSAATTRNSQPCCSRKRIDAPLRGIAGRASAGQHQMPGAVRGQVSGDFQPDRPQPAGHQIRCVVAQFQRCSARLPIPSNQPGNIDRLITQRDLVFPDVRVARRHDLVDQPRPLVGGALRQICQSAPHLRKLQRGGTTESPQATLIRRHGVRVGDSLCATGHHPDGSAQFSGNRGAEEPPRSAQDSVLHPQQRPHRWCTVGVEGRDMHDT